MGTSAIFPRARRRTGMYESFYLRAVAPREPVGAWIRYTVDKPPGGDARGSLWCTVFDALLRLAGEREIELLDWQGMVGHNWGSEHAERWIWLHGVGFEQAPDAWLDVALGRVMIAGAMTPWIANGALSLEGRRLRIGGLGARGLR